MDSYLSAQIAHNDVTTGFVPPLNTDIRFSDALSLHHIDSELNYTPTVTVGAKTPAVLLDADRVTVNYSYNPREYSHIAETHPKAYHIHHEITDKFSWCVDDPEDSKLIKIKKSLISKPKTQYACGSCFAICMAQVFSDCLVVSGAVGWAPNISETWLLANLPKNVHNGCGGGNPASIAPILEKHGALDSSCIDYSWCENDKKICASLSSIQHFDAKSLTSKLNDRIPKNGCWFPQKRFLYKLDKGSNVFFINPEATPDVFRKTVKSHISDFGPCVGGFVVLSNFMSGEHTNPKHPTKGIYFEKAYYGSWLGVSWGKMPKSEGLHAVAVVGWGVEANVEYANGLKGTVPYWHCRNSWGESWGYQKGFFKMAMYPFNQYSQFDKEVMTSIGGPVGSMILMRATSPPVIVEKEQVASKYRDFKRSLPDAYYKSDPEAVVLYNRQHLVKYPSGSEDPPDANTGYDELAFSDSSDASTIGVCVLLILLVVLIIYLKD